MSNCDNLINLNHLLQSMVKKETLQVVGPVWHMVEYPWTVHFW